MKIVLNNVHHIREISYTKLFNNIERCLNHYIVKVNQLMKTLVSIGQTSLIAFPYQLWNNFNFPSSSSSTRRFNIPPPPPPLPISSFHPNNAGVLSHPAASAAAAAACMHPAFNYMFNRPETMPKPPLINHRTNYYNPPQHQSSRNREVSASSSSSASSYCPDITSGLFKSFFALQTHQ